MSRLAAVALSGWVCAAPACSRDRDGPAPAVSAAVPSPKTPDFRSERHAFSARYPGGAAPQVQELGTTETAIGLVSETSYFSAAGDATFDVNVAAYPPGRLSTDVEGLLKVSRDNAVSKPGAKLVQEQPVTLRTSSGKAVQGRLVELVVGGNPAFMAWCFHESRGYTLGAAGKAGAPALSRQAFDEFVKGFRILDGSDL